MESFIGGSSSSSRPIHVYLSFKGDDDTCGFTDSLWAALESNDLNTSWDDKKLHPADSIFLPHHLLKAIRQSNISIVVFSKSYASSIWCLEELCAIAERIHEPRYTVFPIFYDVDPSEVQNQSNSFQKAFAENEQSFSANSHRWRLAMKQVANLSGWLVPCNPCPEVIDDIVREVKKKVRELVYVDADLVGMQSRVREVKELLDLGSSEEVRVVGICGMGGIGKSTLARVLYDKISHHFEASHFLSDASQFDNIVSQGCLNNILVVMDIIDRSCLYSMTWPMTKSHRLQGASRIIITTRDEGVLQWYGKHHIYRVKLLTKGEALRLFCRKAFKCDYPIRGYDEELINKALDYANGLPLAIVKMGSFLCNRRASEWSTALIEFKKVASFMVMQVLKTSFDKLENAKRSFLDISCFFVGKEIKYVEGILDDRSLFEGKHKIQYLIEKSLVTIKDQKIQMHGLLQEMGRRIVGHEFPSKPEKWSRLWDFDDIYRVMQNDTAIDLEVEAIVLELEEDSQRSALRVEALSRMKKLNLLIFRNVKFSGVLKSLPTFLQYISWHQYPFTSLPSSFMPFHLKELILPHSCITSIWDEGDERNEGLREFSNLRNMNLSWSKDLIKMPNSKGIRYLKRLELEGCTKLSHLDPSIADLSKLKFLNVRNCSNLASIPNALFSRPSLEMLNLASCSKFAYCLKFCPYEELAERENIQQSFPCMRQKMYRHKSI